MTMLVIPVMMGIRRRRTRRTGRKIKRMKSGRTRRKHNGNKHEEQDRDERGGPKGNQVIDTLLVSSFYIAPY